MSTFERDLLPPAHPPLDPPASLSEEASHREHLAALEATLFRSSATCDELVFELEAGELRLCPTRL